MLLVEAWREFERRGVDISYEALLGAAKRYPEFGAYRKHRRWFITLEGMELMYQHFCELRKGKQVEIQKELDDYPHLRRMLWLFIAEIMERVNENLKGGRT